ncbi:macro domain-containing protein [Pseudomonas edaphica]|nr:macro domain-containing protein [Pseudomonas edaphica]
MIKVLIGDMFKSDATTLVNTINCVGVMGKGVALEFKKRWPGLMLDYQKKCKAGLVILGKPYLYTDLAGTSIINFPTKGHWRATSRLADIESGLEHLVSNYKSWGVNSIAFPPLGCGNGGLEWDVVGPLMYSHLSKLDIPIEMYAPFGTPTTKLTETFLNPAQQRLFDESEHKGSRAAKLNNNWMIILEVLYQLERRSYVSKVGRTIFQQLCNTVTALGIETELDTIRTGSIQFSEQTKKLLEILANANLVQETKSGRLNHLKTGPEFLKARKKNSELISTNRKKIDKTVNLFSRIKSVEQAEEMATIFSAVTKLKEEKNTNIVAEKELFDFVLSSKQAWNTDEKRNSLASAIRNLAMLGWIRVSFSESLPVAEL